jgi:hypothetical protein
MVDRLVDEDRRLGKSVSERCLDVDPGQTLQSLHGYRSTARTARSQFWAKCTKFPREASIKQHTLESKDIISVLDSTP